jgi:5-methylphenazine-1-carboxylate 1-monooxygenase
MDENPKNDSNPIIIGAGIAGLTLASSLGTQGVRSLVYEKRTSISGDGFGLNIQPSAVEVLYALGLAEKIDAVGIRTRAHRYVDHHGSVLLEQARGIDDGYRFPQISIRRTDLLHLLFCQAKKFAHFKFGAEISSRELADTATHTDIELNHGNQLLVGADGFNSVVREALFPEAMVSNAGNMFLWRGLTLMPRLLDGRTMIIANDNAGIRLIAYPVSRECDTNGMSLINWVLLVPSSCNQLIDPYRNRSAANNFLLKLLNHWSFDWLDLPSLVTGSETIMRTQMIDRDPIDRWSDGNRVLIGDAAHPMFPIGANGATQSIIDGQKLASEITQSVDLFTAIKNFENSRMPVVAKIVHANRKMNAGELESNSLDNEDRAKEIIAVTTHYKNETVI